MNPRIAALRESHVREGLLIRDVVGVDAIAERRNLGSRERVSRCRANGLLSGSADGSAAHRAGYGPQRDVHHIVGDAPPVRKSG